MTILSENKLHVKSLFNEDEIEVSKILIDLPSLMKKSLSSYRFAYNWSTKKLRSAISSPPPLQQQQQQQQQPPLKLPQKASSPTTPLSFNPCHSIHKSKTKSLPLNLRKEELLAALNQRLETQTQLKEAIKTVKLHRQSLIDENCELKAKRQKLKNVNLVEEKEKTMTTCTTQIQPLLEQQQQTTPVNDLVREGAPKTTEYHHTQSPLIFHQISQVNDPSTSTHGPLINHIQNQVHTGAPSEMLFHYSSPLITHHHQQYGFMINQSNHCDPVFRRERGQFDLNVVPEDECTMMMMDARALAAVARRKRIHANKDKKTRGKS